jgi:D-amino-acid dehydrogenase
VCHIAVIGAGITGITTAYALSERGYAVTVFDRQRYAGMETSFANGGQLSVSNAEVWNHWSTIAKGITWMLRPESPLLLNPAPSWHKYSWIAEFIGNIRNYRVNTLATARLALQARAQLFAMADRENIDFDLERRGILHIYRNKSGFDHASSVNQMLLEAGLERHPVTPQEMRAIEPALHGSYYGGFFTPSDSTGDIHKFTRGLAAACHKLGVNFYYDASVHQILHKKHAVEIQWRKTNDHVKDTLRCNQMSFDGVVICAGVDSRDIAQLLGDRINIYPVKGYSITIHLEDMFNRASAPWVSLLDDDTKIVTSRLGADRFRVAGTAEFSGLNRDIRADRIRPLVEWSRTLFPGINTDRVVPWSGLRPMMPNMMPRVGRGSLPKVFYNTGHGHLGWTLSGATAQLIAETVVAEIPPEIRTAS